VKTEGFLYGAIRLTVAEIFEANVVRLVIGFVVVGVAGMVFAVVVIGVSSRVIGADEIDRFHEPIGEFVEILFVKEQFVLLIVEAAIITETLFAFSNRQVVVVSFRRLYVEEISTFTGFNRPGENLSLVIVPLVVSVVVHALGWWLLNKIIKKRIQTT
jgi:hypothetical protein